MEDRHGVPEDQHTQASAERDEMTMELLNRHRLVHILRSVFGATLSPRPKTVRREVEVQPAAPPTAAAEPLTESPRVRCQIDLAALLAQAQVASTGPAFVTTAERIDPPATSVVDTWLANNLRMQLETPVLQVGGRLLGYMPVIVSWPDEMDGHWFDFSNVAIDVVPQLRQNSDCLALIRRLNLYRQVAFRFRDGDFRFLVVSGYVEPGLKYLLEGQGITVYETR